MFGILLPDRRHERAVGEPGIVGARGEEVRVALQIHLVRGHPGDDPPRRRRSVANRADVTGRAVQPDARDAPRLERRTNRPRVPRRVEDEPDALVAGARTLRQLVFEHRRQHSPDPVREADALLRTDRSVLEVIDDVGKVLAVGRGLGAHQDREQQHCRGRGRGAGPHRSAHVGVNSWALAHRTAAAGTRS